MTLIERAHGRASIAPYDPRSLPQHALDAIRQELPAHAAALLGPCDCHTSQAPRLGFFLPWTWLWQERSDADQPAALKCTEVLAALGSVTRIDDLRLRSVGSQDFSPDCASLQNGNAPNLHIESAPCGGCVYASTRPSGAPRPSTSGSACPSSVNDNETEFRQCRSPVGGGPSGKTCPRWLPQRAQTSSTRIIP